ncbi:MAG: response regulator transcription factor [Verrucomicrobiota bacterium]
MKQIAGPKNFLIAEDHASTRVGIRQILSEGFPGAAFGEAGNARDTLALVHKHRWDLLILDISLPDRSGLEVLRDVKRLRARLPVLIYSAHPEDQFAAHALRLGAAGYLTKERAPEELNLAAQSLLAGNQFVSPGLAARIVAGFVTRGSGLPHENLSKREFLVLRLIASGKSGKAMAAELQLSPKTISTFRSRILKKLQLTTTAELVLYAIRHDLARPGRG